MILKLICKEYIFDNAATTPVDPQVLEAMLPYFTEKFGNPSSIHSFGQEAESALEESREKAAEILGRKAKEIFFTSGATESNNMAIQGVAEAFKKNRPHFITSKIEHPSVLETFEALKKRGFAVDFINVDSKGLLKLDELKKTIRKNTVLISIMYANNEIGVIQPIKEIGEIVSKERAKRGEKDLPNFHTDAAQPFNYLPCKADYLGVDFGGLSCVESNRWVSS